MLSTADLEVKIGDFGLAAKIQKDGERKRTICGTPNYIGMICDHFYRFLPSFQLPKSCLTLKMDIVTRWIYGAWE